MHIYGCKTDRRQTVLQPCSGISFLLYEGTENRYYLQALVSVNLEWNIIYAVSKILLLLASFCSIHT